MAKVHLNLTIDPDLKERLRRIAAQEERSLSNLIAYLLRRYADEKEKSL